MMNSLQQQLYNRIKDYTFDRAGSEFTFSQRLARENGWSEEYTARVIQEYRKFVFLAVVAGHTVTPSEQVDRVWHLHLTYTRSYWDEFCPQILETSLHHQPTEGGNREREKYRDLYEQTKASYKAFFNSEPPLDIWSNTEDRFGKYLVAQQVNLVDNWVIPKPKILVKIINAIANTVAKISCIWRGEAPMVAAAFLGILILCGAALPGLADSNFYWDYLNVDLDLQSNGDLLVTEQQKYIFNGEHDPVHHRFIKLNYRKKIKDVEVLENQQSLPIDTWIEDDRYYIEWQEPNPVLNSHEVTLKYRAKGALSHPQNQDKIEWQGVFPYRPAEIKHSEIKLHIPSELKDKLKQYSINGNFQQTEEDNNTVIFTSLKSLPPRQAATVKASMDSNLLGVNETATSLLGYLFMGIIGLIMLGFIALFLFMVWLTMTGQIKSSGYSDSSDFSSGCSGCGGCGGCGGGD